MQYEVERGSSWTVRPLKLFNLAVLIESVDGVDVVNDRRVVRPMLRIILFITWWTFDGPFSAVWTATIARVGAFWSIFRDLQDMQAFAPLQIQKFSKILYSKTFENITGFFVNFAKFMQILHFAKWTWWIFVWIWWNFDELWWILMNFDEILMNSDEFWWILMKNSSKVHQNFGKFWWINSSIHHFCWWTTIHQQPRLERGRLEILRGQLLQLAVHPVEP